MWTRSGAVTLADSVLSLITSQLPGEFDEDETLAETVLHNGASFRVFWQPVEVDGRYPNIVQAAASMHELEAELSRLLWLFLGMIAMALLLSGLAARVLMKVAFRPIDQMADGARLQRGALRPAGGCSYPDDEVRRLAETLNGLLARIQTAFESQQQFVADASHELRTPLTVIRTELEFASRSLDGVKSRESVVNAIAETERLERLTNQLLTLVRLDSGRHSVDRGAVRVDDLLLDCLTQVRPRASVKRVTMQVHIAEVLETTGDAALLRSMLLNIIENAVKYSPEDATIQVELRRHDLDERFLKIVVTDAGPGIPEEEQEHVFRRFYRAKAQRSEANGSGLGLAIARNVIEIHGGELSVMSAAGHGSKFTVKLPCIGHESERAK
ncbi:MAG: HAMP domain-containing histidine kinase [bacterium]|nr:HAMP domain-containing histidine kinase [bacterium]